MYKIYKENELIWTNGTPETGLYSAKISLGVNSANTFEASVASGLELFKDLPVLNKRIFIFQDTEKDPIFEGRLIKRVTDFYGNTTYSFEGALGYLNDSIQPPVDYTGQTIETIFNGLLTEHNKQVEDWKQLLPGRITVEDHTESDTYSGKGRLDDTNTDREVYTADSDTTGINQANLTTGYETTWDAINNLLINNLAGYLVIRYEGDKKYLDYLKEYMPSEGQVILFGSNLLDYSSTLDYSSLCTGVLPLGYSKGADSGDGSNSEDDRTVYTQESDPLSNVKNKLTIESVNGGSKILWNQDAVNNYGKIVKSVEWSDCKDASKLLDKARKYLTNTQFDNLSLECKIIDLHFVDNTEGPLHCMHLVRVKSEPHGLDKMMPISSMEIDLMNPANDTITIGQTYNSLTGEFAGTQNDVSSLSGTTSNITQTIDNNVKTAWTNIQKTDDAITLEAENRDKAVSAALKITADQISSEVSARKESEKGIVDSISSIKQTAEGISTEVKTKIGETEAHSIFKQDAASFTFKASQIEFEGDKIKLDTKGSCIYSDDDVMYMYAPDSVGGIRMQKGNKMIGIDNNGIAISAPSKDISTPSAYDKKVRNIAWFNGSYLYIGDLDLSGFATISDLQNIKSGYIKKSVYDALVKRRDALVKRIKDIRALTNKTSVPDRHLRNLINSEVN